MDAFNDSVGRHSQRAVSDVQEGSIIAHTLPRCVTKMSSEPPV